MLYAKAAIVVLLALLAVAYAAPSPSDHRIKALPGLSETPSFDQYAGLIEITNSKSLFYWFVRAQSNPDTAPLVLWLNGGPGCSSLGGFFGENGPFVPTEGGKTLVPNPQAWNQVANMIFLESPVGVGFSSSTNASEYEIGDAQTAEDVYEFLQIFFGMYPSMRSLPLTISGESYAGHYCSVIAAHILDKNSVTSAAQHINLKQVFVGNPWVSPADDNYGAAFAWYAMNMISREAFDGIVKNCNFSDVGPLMAEAGVVPSNDMCDDFTNRAFKEFGDINIYDVLADVCHDSGKQGLRLLQHRFPQIASLHDTPLPICIDDYVQAYLRRADVQVAIHAVKQGQPLVAWQDCSDIVKYSYADVLTSTVPLYQRFMTVPGMRVMVFSGSIDGIVPTLGTRKWIYEKVQPTVRVEWHPYTVDGQVGGYVQHYNGGFSFATVRGAGHMCPATQPARSFFLFKSFMSGVDL